LGARLELTALALGQAVTLAPGIRALGPAQWVVVVRNPAKELVPSPLGCTPDIGPPLWDVSVPVLRPPALAGRPDGRPAPE